MLPGNEIKIVVGKKIENRYVRMIRDRFPFVSIVLVDSEEDQEREMKDAHVLFTRMIPKNPSIAPDLKWVQFMWEGVDRMTPKMRDSDVILTNARGVHSRQMAEHIFTYLLNLSRNSKRYFDLQRESEWLPWPEQPRLKPISGSTLGIIGYGRIGQEVARIACGFDMKVLAVKRDPKSLEDGSPVPDILMGVDDLHQMLSISDHVIVAVPLTAETEGMIMANEFKKMKKSAFFVNVGRGSVVNETDLVDALENGEIAGAGLDVFEVEPLPANSPLWDMENVIITPHSSVGGDPSDDAVVNLFMENLERLENGERMINIIDKKRGY